MNIHTKYKIDVNGCWNWLGELNKKGYGRIAIKGKKYASHRYFYELSNEKIVEGMEIDHLCRNRKCVNPEHLEVVTRSENVKRAWKVRIANTPNCIHGHPFSGENLYIVIDKRNGKRARNCKICKVAANKRWVKRKQVNLVSAR